ncbi:hypothetical protein JG688_00009953 [Phytophthora aleatoria]|uniref:Uncharacterized protein n=1 Tax=Phytophthora aleatoria TaxID=2496075 RepID=A0A8J5IN93_9STRA|nr:hypothetical protein JG688_00009953 [Phytophthora aleatoria]
MTVEIPFGLHASRFVEQFATRVLSKVDYGERGSADTFLMPTVSNSSLWSWWRNGVFVVKLAELNVLAITKREASLALQWILRHDFEEWTDDKLVDTYLQPLIAEIGALIAQHTRPGETVSSLLDVIDAFSRGISAPDSSAHSSFKRRASFDVVTNAQNSILFFFKRLAPVLVGTIVDVVRILKICFSAVSETGWPSEFWLLGWPLTGLGFLNQHE